jgi:hypothetical protein
MVSKVGALMCAHTLLAIAEGKARKEERMTVVIVSYETVR